MNAIQKAAFAVSALVITLVGAALVTAPIAFAQPMQVVAHVHYQDVSRDSGLIALNRR